MASKTTHQIHVRGENNGEIEIKESSKKIHKNKNRFIKEVVKVLALPRERSRSPDGPIDVRAREMEIHVT